MVLGGFTMHRIAGEAMNPQKDTENKLTAIKLFKGAKVLDTCMGLGYTAMAAAEKVAGASEAKEGVFGSVTTIEYDAASIEMCAHNPWSQSLFDESLPITVMQGDSCELIKSFPDNSFNAIIHDPPARALCRKDLYGLEFYKELR
jgi:predicted methyltransferase